MNKFVVLLIASLFVIEAFGTSVKLPLRRKSPTQKRAHFPLGISTAGEFYVQIQGKFDRKKNSRFELNFN